MKDAIVEEVRRVRLQIEEEYNHDTKKYLEHIYKAQKKHGTRLTHRQPRPLKKRKAI